MPDQSFVQQIPAVAALFEKADVTDHKMIIGKKSLREFVAGLLSYQPAWVTMLYYVRGVVVRMLGFTQEKLPRQHTYRPEEVPFTVGDSMYIFEVRLAEVDSYWVAEANDKHLRAALGVVVEPLAAGQNRYHVLTLVYYHNWRGPVYFNLIRPFHHVVVWSMMRHAIQPPSHTASP